MTDRLQMESSIHQGKTKACRELKARAWARTTAKLEAISAESSSSNHCVIGLGMHYLVHYDSPYAVIGLHFTDKCPNSSLSASCEGEDPTRIAAAKRTGLLGPVTPIMEFA